MSELIDGASIRMGGKNFIVPALSFGQIKRLMPKLKETNSIGAQMTPEQMDNVTDIVFTALSRNYPDLKIEDVSDLIDLNNLPTIFAAVMGQSGLIKSGEPKLLGEAPAGTN